MKQDFEAQAQMCNPRQKQSDCTVPTSHWEPPPQSGLEKSYHQENGFVPHVDFTTLKCKSMYISLQKREYVTNRLKFPSNYLLIGEFLSRLVHALCMFQGKQASLSQP